MRSYQASYLIKILSCEIFKFEQVTDLSIQHNLTHNAYKVNPFWTCLSMILFMLSSCSTKIPPVYHYENEDLLKRSSQILYITIQVQKETIQHRINAEIVQYQISNGKLKFTDDDIMAKEIPGSWRISLLDQKDRIIHSRYIRNPFDINKESFQENGQIEQRSLQLSEAQIPLRFPFLQQMKKIQIDTLTSTHKMYRIFLQQLTEIKESIE